jgi:hypothetical protein
MVVKFFLSTVAGQSYEASSNEGKLSKWLASMDYCHVQGNRPEGVAGRLSAADTSMSISIQPNVSQSIHVAMDQFKGNDVQKAVEAYREGKFASINKAATEYKATRSVVQDRLKGVPTCKDSHAPQRLLTREQEDQLAD